jgi:hypothetical protein
MITIILRQASFIILASGVIVGIVDATRSVATNVVQMTMLGPVLEDYTPALANGLASTKKILSLFAIGGWNLGRLVDYINAVPMSLLAVLVFLLFYGVASRNREEPHF